MVTIVNSHPIGRLTDKVAIVVSSSAGLGWAIALAFAREGAKVVCSELQPLAKVDIKDETHVAAYEAITQEGGIGIFAKADIVEVGEAVELVHRAVEVFGRDHITMGVNARGTFLGCKYAIAQMMKQDLHPSGERGWIINLSSVAGLVGFGGCPVYCSSKGAIAQLTKQVAVKYRKHKIHVNTIYPGAIETVMIQPLTENDAAAKTLKAAQPWGAFGETRNVAGATVFLASEDAAFVRGVLWPIDGGFVAG